MPDTGLRAWARCLRRLYFVRRIILPREISALFQLASQTSYFGIELCDLFVATLIFSAQLQLVVVCFDYVCFRLVQFAPKRLLNLVQRRALLQEFVHLRLLLEPFSHHSVLERTIAITRVRRSVKL